jgi:hypothetical protein
MDIEIEKMFVEGHLKPEKMMGQRRKKLTAYSLDRTESFKCQGVKR